MRSAQCAACHRRKVGCTPVAIPHCLPHAQVVFATNERPSINDVTAPEMHDVLERAAKIDQVFGRAVAEETLRGVSSGNDTAAIDLLTVRPA